MTVIRYRTTGPLLPLTVCQSLHNTMYVIALLQCVNTLVCFTSFEHCFQNRRSSQQQFSCSQIAATLPVIGSVVPARAFNIDWRSGTHFVAQSVNVGACKTGVQRAALDVMAYQSVCMIALGAGPPAAIASKALCYH